MNNSRDRIRSDDQGLQATSATVYAQTGKLGSFLLPTTVGDGPIWMYEIQGYIFFHFFSLSYSYPRIVFGNYGGAEYKGI